MQFDGDSDLSYEITMATFEFVDFLFDVIVALRQKRPADFSRDFTENFSVWMTRRQVTASVMAGERVLPRPDAGTH
jgi:hypothetical protein